MVDSKSRSLGHFLEKRSHGGPFFLQVCPNVCFSVSGNRFRPAFGVLLLYQEMIYGSGYGQVYNKTFMVSHG